MSILIIILAAIALFLFLAIPSLKQNRRIKDVDNAFKNFEGEEAEDEDDSLPENWLEEIEARIMATLSQTKRVEVMPIVKARFSKIERLLLEWHKMPELVNNYGDTERVFKVAVLNIERSCKEFADDECSFDELRKRLDKQVDGLKTIIKCLSDLAGCSRQP